MPIKRLTVWTVLATALLASSTLLAAPVTSTTSRKLDNLVLATANPSLMNLLPVFDPAPMLAQSAMPTGLGKLGQSAADTDSADGVDNAVADLANDTNELQKSLIALAMKLRDIRYVRGGRTPSTGFDCSGFVRYVFAHAIGLELPSNSGSQFLAGLKVKRDDIQPGDLVFFRTAGRRGQGRISHVGIYVANGQFIHSPSRGKTVRVDSLSESYWAKRFAGAKRPEGMAENG
jgi:cell wall-associated NlpC family hydrolase